MNNMLKGASPQAEILAVEQLAKLIHKSPASIRSDASRNPSALPPICRLPGTKRLLWRLIDVQSWIAQYVHGASVIPIPPTAKPDLKRKRGRPRKTAMAQEPFSSEPYSPAVGGSFSTMQKRSKVIA